ncbi:glycosyltransferase [Geomonas limicola]|uniref:glycosyltransferase n=1 Tax=Geomonas limicola TaxID=2740186 RepID=UPI00161A33A5|nr:glycosyltransferase [Geomonas limicola]
MLSIITPVLNSAEYIEENIRAISKLPFEHEHIIVDGGSTDGTLEILDNHRTNIRLLSQSKNNGMYGAIDEGFKCAKGKYITYVNADDRPLSDGYIAMYAEITSERCDFVYGDSILYFKNERRLQRFHGKHFGKFLLKNGVMPFVQPSSMYTRELYEEVGGFNHETFRIIGDRDLFQRMALTQARFRYLPVDASIFLKYGASLADRSRDRHLIERNFCIKNNDRGMCRVVFHISSLYSRLVRSGRNQGGDLLQLYSDGQR